MRPVWDSLLSKAFFSPHHLCRREPVRHYRDAGSREYLWVAALTVMAMDVRHVLYGRHCVAVLFSVCKNRKPPCGRWPDG